jgi:NADPH-dependent glutamate synthase beta subunit-like oxidoreductase
MGKQPSHCIAVIGGAVAGAEVAGTLAARGVEVAVFEQNPRPFGKIEDGLPRWHVALRQKEYESIGENLAKPGVHFVPRTRIGQELSLRELSSQWGFSGVVLACGAWRDRPLAIDGAEAFVGRGLIYQNPFIIWFNHADEAGYTGPVFEPEDGALVVGGGLASIDVVKALMLETVRAKLRARGIEQDLVEMEVKGIPKTLEHHGITLADLGLRGCTLFYRRSEADMPLVEIPEGADEKRREKIAVSRGKLLAKAMEKYCFHFEPLCLPEGLIVEGDRLVGLRFRRTAIEGNRVVPQAETFERRGCYVISSIGSIPEPIEGIPMKGELFAFSDWDLGRLADYPTLFSAGNVVTGKGNIVASRKHARAITAAMAESFLGLADDGGQGEAALGDALRAEARERAAAVAGSVAKQPPIATEALAQLRARIGARQRAVGYGGDYAAWIASVSPRS